MSESGSHHPPEFKQAAEMEWEMGRFGMSQIPVSLAAGPSDGTQRGISQICAGRVLPASPARSCGRITRSGLVHEFLVGAGEPPFDEGDTR